MTSDIYDLPELNLAPFDYVLFLGVLYHLRHPLLALETVCSLTTEVAVIDSFVIDGDEREHITTPIPFMEFYETNELGGQIDNWFGPTIECLMAFCRSAGFARVEYVNTWHRHARVLCYRKWEPEPTTPTCAPPVLNDALNARNYGVNFRSRKEEYLTFWFRISVADLSRADLRPEIGGFGTQALSLNRGDGGQWSMNVRLPPGLKPGRHPVRLRTTECKFSNECYIYIDWPTDVGDIRIVGLHDGISWQENLRVTVTGRFVSLYATGFADNTDRNNLEVVIGKTSLRPIFVGAKDENGSSEVNVQLPKELAIGRYEVTLQQAGKSSNAVGVDIIP